MTNTKPDTGTALTVLPSFGGGGGGSALVINVWSGPKVVPALLLATSRTWYSAFGNNPDTDADTG